MVQKAVAAIKSEGAEKAYAEISNPSGKFVDRDLYIVVYGLDGVVLAHGANASRVGTNQIDDKDPDGKAFVKERVELAKQQPELLAVLQIHEPGDQEGRAQANVLRAAGRDGGLRRHLSIGEAVEATMRTRVFVACGAGRADRGRGLHRFGAGRPRPISSPTRSARRATNATPRKAPSKTRKPRSPTRRCGSCNARAEAIASGSSPTWQPRSSSSTRAKTRANRLSRPRQRRQTDHSRRRKGLGEGIEAAV